jgi:osmotically-inducible protein OsmY
MPDLRQDRATLAKFSGLALGVVLGGVLGPIVFGPIRMGPPAAASVGCFAGALIGYLLVSLALLIAQYRQDAELRRAAEAVKAELGLPKTVSIKIKHGRATLEGEVERYSERQEAERAISTLPGIKQVINRIRMRPSGERVSTSADDIRKRITDHFVRLAELDGRGIQVQLRDSRIVLEGTVHSVMEASQAEDLAWNIPGVVEVENRLKVAA